MARLAVSALVHRSFPSVLPEPWSLDGLRHVAICKPTSVSPWPKAPVKRYQGCVESITRGSCDIAAACWGHWTAARKRSTKQSCRVAFHGLTTSSAAFHQWARWVARSGRGADVLTDPTCFPARSRQLPRTLPPHHLPNSLHHQPASAPFCTAAPSPSLTSAAASLQWLLSSLPFGHAASVSLIRPPWPPTCL